jgi:aspartate kinase
LEEKSREQVTIRDLKRVMGSVSHRLVMKFGGAAVATPQAIGQIAEIICRRKKDYSSIIVVTSAMGKTTDELIHLAKQVHPEPPHRELDMLLTVGERVSMSLLAMALHLRGVSAVSFTGSQAGIMTTAAHTDAQIIEVRPRRLLPTLDKGEVAVVAGFQGVSQSGEITTLGRGGSDTTAVALGIALQASHVEFYKDVPAIFDFDPKIAPEARPHAELSFEEALSIVSKGARVLHARALLLAARNGLPLHLLSFMDPGCERHKGTWIRSAESRSKDPCYEA